MKRKTKWSLLLTLAAVTLLIGWHATPRATSQGPAKNKKSSQTQQQKKNKNQSSNPTVAIDKSVQRLLDLESLKAKAPGKRSIFVDEQEGEGGEEGEDPDLPSWLAGKVDKAAYMRLRGDYIDMMRGRPYNLSYDPREKAIKEMTQQEAKQRQLMDRLGASPVTWTPLGPHPIPNGQTSIVTAPVSGRTISIAVH
ncbi:MAG TPA: hypothetical protein VGO69_10505, partial [Pyrinomonadaceae bacterium]|nr:hypothetical protein [Pyrinomonadaceae bacterium]